MKFGFVTCVKLGLSCIESIYEVGGKLDLLITLNDNKAKKKSGRIYLDDFSAKNNVDLLKIDYVNDAAVIEAVKKYELDWLFIIGWSQIASVELINAPKQGCIGMHPTLLPQGRGRASIPWAIIKGLKKTGVTMFRLDEGVDTGDIIAQQEIEISDEETATTLYDKVNLAHEKLMKDAYPMLLQNQINLIKQDESLATYWEGRTPAHGELNLAMNVEEADRLVRATTKPYPGAFLLKDKQKIIIWKGKVAENPGHVHPAVKFSNGYYELLNYDLEN